MSTVKRGTYYKNKTREWYKKLGYYVVLTEYKTAIPIKGRWIFITKDLMGSDGIAMKKETNEFILWNSKGAATKNSLYTMKSGACDEFEKFPFPKCVKRQTIIWEPRVKQPLIVECN